MNWVRASRLYELYDICNDYISSLNHAVVAIAFKRVSDADMESFCDRFIDKYPNLEMWTNNHPYRGIKITGPALIYCMDELERKLKEEDGMFYLLGIYTEPNDTVSIKYSKPD